MKKAPAEQGEGFEHHRHDERRSSTQEPSKSQPLMDSVAIYAPWANDRAANLRRRLLTARDIGAARAVQTTELLRRDLFWIINDLAGTWVFSGATEEQLTELARPLDISSSPAMRSAVLRSCDDGRSIF
jgi:hypothetical protein